MVTGDAVNVTVGDTVVAVLRRDASAPHGHTFEWSAAYLDRVRNGRRLIPDNTRASASLPETAGPRRYHTNARFEDLPGFLWDSLPDAWGGEVMARTFKDLGITGRPTVLQKLAYVGERGMGALRFRPSLGNGGDDGDSARRIDLARTAALAQLIVGGSAQSPGEAVELAALGRAGGTPGGAHAKCLVALDAANAPVWAADTDFLRGRSELTPCILKIDGVSAARGLPPEYLANCTRIEHAYAAMARAAGLSPAPMRLLEAAGRWHLAIERFDRRGATRLHHMTYAAVNEELHSAGAAWYSELAENLSASVAGVAGIPEIFRRAVFNFAAHVTDDHLKNHGVLLEDGKWRLSPAYDLVWSPADTHAMLLGGVAKPEDLTGDRLAGLAETCGVEREEAERVCGEVIEAVSRWREFAAASHVDAGMIGMVGRSLDNDLKMMRRAARGLDNRIS